MYVGVCFGVCSVWYFRVLMWNDLLFLNRCLNWWLFIGNVLLRLNRLENFVCIWVICVLMVRYLFSLCCRKMVVDRWLVCMWVFSSYFICRLCW